MNFQYTSELQPQLLDKEGVVVIGSVAVGEDRGAWWSSFKKARTFTALPIGNPVLEFKVGTESYQVRNNSHLEKLLEMASKCGEVHIDITTLPYEIWTALVKVAIRKKRSIKAIYLEPEKYIHLTRGDILREFDLSVGILGLANLPGFTYFGYDEDEPFGVIALLGFEGARFGFLVSMLEAEGNKSLYPLIGVPGFRPEFERYAFEGNLHTLEKTESFDRLVFARANCPFSVFNQIIKIAPKIKEGLIKFGLIGTRPHALGAVLYCLLTNRKTSLLFDFPTKRPGRTEGVGRALVYDIGKFSNELPNVT